MKKLYSLLVMMLVGFAATWAADETITFSDQGYSNQQAITTVSGTDFTITFDKGTNSSNAPKYFTSGTAIRAYAGNTFTVSSTTKTITTIEIGFGSSDSSNAITADADTYEDGTWTGSASSVTFTIGGTSGNRRLASIAVTYAEGGSEPAQKYTIHYNQMENGSVAGPAEAAEGANVTLTVTPDNGYLLETLTVVDENDAVINDANSNQFTMPASAVYVSATFEEKPAADGDVLDLTFTGVSGTNYTDWSGKTGDSGAVYAGNSAGGNSSIQLRSSNSNSGIVSTTSGGNVRKVTVTWNSNTTNGRTLDIYGSNTAYTAASELYNTSTQGTKLGSIVCGTSTELEIEDDYAYVGLRSNNGAMYLEEIVIEWEAGAAPAVAEPVISGTTPFEGETEVTITADDGLSIYYTLDGNDPTVNSTLYSGAFTINATTTVKAIATDGTNVSSIASKEFELVVPITTLAQLWNEVKDLSTGASGDEVTFAGEVGVVYQNGSNLYVQDATGSALIYGSNIGTFTAGNVLNSGWSATPKNYNSLIELTNPSNLSVKEGASYEPELTTVAVADIDNDMQNKYIKLENVNLGEYSSKNFTIAQSGNEITGRDNWSLFGNENYFGGEGTYNVVGFVAKYNNNLQIYPIEITAVDVPEPVKYAIEIDAQIVNGTVVADKAEAAEGETVTLTVTPATGYELEAITVLDGDANEVEVSANHTFEMPASDVIVSATFAEQGEQPQPTTGDWVKTDASALKTGDVVVFVELTKLSALPNDGGASAPAFTAITLADNDTKLAAAPADNLQWTVTVTNGSYQFKNADGDYLYCNDANNGVRVGTGTANAFTIDTESGYLKSTTYTRYLGVYNTQDWRCYSSATAANIKDQEFAFFKQASTEPVTKYAIEIDDQIVNGSIEADKAEAAEGETVTLTVMPASGYELDAITVLDANLEEVTVSNNAFTMPASNVLVSATFKEAAPVEMKTTNATIVFVSRDADSSSEFSTLDKLLEQVEEGADYITAISDASKVYGGKNGLKLGTNSAIGKFTITLDGTYAAKKLIVGAAKYGSDAGNLTVAGNTIAADDLVAEIKEFEFELDPTVGLSEIAIATSAKRAYVKSIAIICEEEQPVETTDMAEVTEAGEYVVTVGNVVAFDDDAQTVYTTDGQENWLPILIEDADLYAEAKAHATLSQIAGSFDASKTAPLFTATAFKAEGNFEKNSQEIYPFDLADEEQELNPKAGQVIKIKGIWYGGELRAYSGANGGNRGRSFTVLGATDLVEGTAYSIPVAVTLKKAWDEEASAGAPKRVAKDGDAAFQNLQGKIVGGADMIEGVSTAVTDLNSDKAISGVQYVNVAGQVSAEPFEGVNIVVTTYVDGSRSAVKVVR